MSCAWCGRTGNEASHGICEWCVYLEEVHMAIQDIEADEAVKEMNALLKIVDPDCQGLED